jgi:phosphonate transport system permease protein
MPTLRFATFGADMAEWFWGIKGWLKLLWQTVLIAYTGTILGTLGGFLLCFVAAANLGKSGWLALRYPPLPRILPHRSRDRLRADLRHRLRSGTAARRARHRHPHHGRHGQALLRSGREHRHEAGRRHHRDRRGWWQIIRFAVVPQVLSNFASYSLLRFEINVRGASIMGFVGAGGIGQDLIEAIRKFYFTDISAILLLIIVTVMLIDYGTERLRHALLSLEHGR